MERNLALELVFATEVAAIAAARLRGLGDNKAADRAATGAMRRAFARAPICGIVRSSEGRMDGCSPDEMLVHGERLGLWQENMPFVDITADPLEGTKLCAFDQSGAIATMAFAERGGFLDAPDMYMRKIAVGPAARGAIDIRESVSWNLEAIARAKRVRVRDLTAIVLDRDRHKDIIRDIRACGAHVRLISDGDLMAAIATADPSTGIDVLFGSGGAPEGVLAAAALRSMGGDMQVQLAPETDAEADEANQLTGRPIDHVYMIDELARGSVMFAASGVTDGPVLRGVRFNADGSATVESLVTRSATGSIRKITKLVAKSHVAVI